MYGPGLQMGFERRSECIENVCGGQKNKFAAGLRPTNSLVEDKDNLQYVAGVVGGINSSSANDPGFLCILQPTHGIGRLI